MTRTPLILSDTGMVLLRAYIAANDEVSINRFEFEEDEGKNKYSVYEQMYLQRKAREYRNLWQHRDSLERDLMSDIWYVWRSRDVLLTRHLDWHVIFDFRLALLADQVFTAYHSLHTPQLPAGREHFKFRQPLSDALVAAYLKACSSHGEGNI